MPATNPIKTIPREEAIWLAGLLDGEGCFGSYRCNGGRNWFTTVVLKMTDRDVVDHAAELMGGNVKTIPQHNPKHKTQYVVQIQNIDGVNRVGLAVFQWMGERRKSEIAKQLEVNALRQETRTEGLAWAKGVPWAGKGEVRRAS